MSLSFHLQDWSAWIRRALAPAADAYREGEALRQQMGEDAYLRAYGEGLGAEWKLAEWAQRQPDDPWDAWMRCPRADWLLIALAHASADVRTRTLCACDVARSGLVHIPEGEPYVREAIEAAEAWALGHQSLAHVQRMAGRAASYAVSAAKLRVRLAAEAARGPAAAARGGPGHEAARAALADGPDPDEVATSHRICAERILARPWVPTVPTDLDHADDVLQAAWAWLGEVVPVVQLSTAQVLAAASVRWVLVGPPQPPGPGPGPGPSLSLTGPLVRAIGERIAAAEAPTETLRAFEARLQSAEGPPDGPRRGLQDL